VSRRCRERRVRRRCYVFPIGRCRLGPGCAPIRHHRDRNGSAVVTK
jgi:hypothetical protein